MTATEYSELRASIGSQSAVAAQLGLTRGTITRREAGHLQISTEAQIAIQWLAKQTLANSSNTLHRAKESSIKLPPAKPASSGTLHPVKECSNMLHPPSALRTPLLKGGGKLL